MLAPPTVSSNIMTFKCQCGRRTLNSSVTPAGCQGCDYCATSYSRSGVNHVKLEDHRFTIKEKYGATGKTFFKCSSCGLIEKDSYLKAIK